MANKKPSKKEKALAAKYPDMPEEERNFRSEIDDYLKSNPGKYGRKYQYPQMTEKEKKRKEFFYLIRSFIPVVILALLLYVVFKIGSVPSVSMVPTFSKGDMIVANRLAYKFNKPQRGDIIIFRKNGSCLVKRVIGLAGETVELKGGNVYINDVLLNEPYLTEDTFTLPFTDGNGQYIFEVPQNSVLLFGDNRTLSADARVWTDKAGNPAPFVSCRNIIGKVILSFGKTGLKTHKGYSYVSGQIDSYEIETSDVISATIDPNSVPTDSELIIIETLPISAKEHVEETSPSDKETEQATLPIEDFEEAQEPEGQPEADTDGTEKAEEE